MKKIKYGSRDRTKEKSHRCLQELKEGDDDVCGAVLDTLNADYLSYITNLVKANKTPSKNKIKTQEKIQSLFTKDPKGEGERRNPHIDKKNNRQNSPKSEASAKNCTLPLKKVRGMVHGHSHREGHSSLYEKPQIFKPNTGKRQLMREHYNRFPTQEAEKPNKVTKNEQTSIICCSEESDRQILTPHNPSKQFIAGLDNYLLTLQNIDSKHKKRTQTLSRHHYDDEDIRDIDQILGENIKLRKKVKKFEQKTQQIQQTFRNHFINCRKKEKSQKNRIHQLIQTITHALSKIHSQKEQIDTMKDLLKNFGRKARYCAQSYVQSEASDLEEEINESLVRAMRPSRAHSDNKLKKKSPLNQFEAFIMERDE